jgi:hypothetical protein
VVYVGSANGKLYALSNVGGLAHSSWSMFRHNPWHTGNPATLTLASGVRLGDLDFQFQVRGLSGMNCSVEGSQNLESWSTLGSVTLPTGGSATFTDVQASGYQHRFYRARSGAILSYNSLGYVAVPVPTGYSMIANQLDNPAGNAVGVLLPSPPDGTTVYEWDENTDQFVINVFWLGVWSNPNMTLNPGEGVLVLPGALTTFSFVGSLRQGALANPVPSGMSIRSSMVPQTGILDIDLGYPVAEGDTVLRYDNATASYITDSFVDGQWEGDDPPPRPRVAESFWITTSAAKDWLREFSVWNP